MTGDSRQNRVRVDDAEVPKLAHTYRSSDGVQHKSHATWSHDGLLRELAKPKALPSELVPSTTATARPSRALAAPCHLCGAKRGEPCREAFMADGTRWPTRSYEGEQIHFPPEQMPPALAMQRRDRLALWDQLPSVAPEPPPARWEGGYRTDRHRYVLLCASCGLFFPVLRSPWRPRKAECPACAAQRARRNHNASRGERTRRLNASRSEED